MHPGITLVDSMKKGEGGQLSSSCDTLMLEFDFVKELKGFYVIHFHFCF